MSPETHSMESILSRVQKGDKLARDELQTIVDSFASADGHPKSYLALSLLWQNAAKGTGSSSVDGLLEQFRQIITECLSETNEASFIRGITFMTALYRIDADSAYELLSSEGTLENVMDSVDLQPSPELAISVSKLLAEACGHKKSREALNPGVRKWLDFQSMQTKAPELAASAAVALAKLWHASGAEKANEDLAEITGNIDIEPVTAKMKAIVSSGPTHAGLAEAVEALAYLSTQPSLKEALSGDPAFLNGLFQLIPTRKGPSISSALLYGIIAITHNLTRYRPQLTQEQRQIEKLRKMANSSQQPQSSQDAHLDDSIHVKDRIHRLIAAGVLPVLPAAAVLTESSAIQLDVGRVLLSIVEEKEVRGNVLQFGGGKALRWIVKGLLAKVDDDKNLTTIPVPLEPLQALAKLTITSPPIHVYGADIGGVYDAIRPMSIMVLNQAANQLQQFEGLMALTNLASHSPDVSNRVANVDGLLNKVELLLLEEHTLLSRASMELICNLVSGSETAFERYAGDGKTNKIPKSKIHVFLALCDTDDIPTRLAASGTLAVLASAPAVCQALFDLQTENGRFLAIMTSLFSPVPQTNGDTKEDTNLIHRAAVCMQSLLSNIDHVSQLATLKSHADFASLQNAMVGLIKRAKSIALGPGLPPLAEAVKVLLTSK